MLYLSNYCQTHTVFLTTSEQRWGSKKFYHFQIRTNQHIDRDRTIFVEISLKSHLWSPENFLLWLLLVHNPAGPFEILVLQDSPLFITHIDMSRQTLNSMEILDSIKRFSPFFFNLNASDIYFSELRSVILLDMQSQNQKYQYLCFQFSDSLCRCLFDASTAFTLFFEQTCNLVPELSHFLS